MKICILSFDSKEESSRLLFFVSLPEGLRLDAKRDYSVCSSR